jgi:hypothetical protein
MVTIPCPWCDHEVAWTEPAPTECELRCDGCATVVDLAPEPAVVHPAADRLPLAA